MRFFEPHHCMENTIMHLIEMECIVICERTETGIYE